MGMHRSQSARTHSRQSVVSLDKVFCPGQAYVALSRVRTLDGLIINNFKESAIYCNEKIDSAMKNMLRLTLENHSVIKTPDRFTIALHNVQSLRAHVQDIQVHGQLMNADCICLTETWLKVEDMCRYQDLFLRTIRELSVMTRALHFSLI